MAVGEHEQVKKIAEIEASAEKAPAKMRKRPEDDGGGQAEPITCTPKALPRRLLFKSADVAYRVNPVNAPSFNMFGQPGAQVKPLPVARIAVLTSKYWGARVRQLTVSFMETTPTDLRRRIIEHMNAWTLTIGISFVYTAGVGQVRISRGGNGYWSYLGTDVLLIPRGRPTMNLQGFTMNTGEREYLRVIRHETGHTLGCPHEHMRADLVARIDPAKAYAYFWRTQGWDRAMVDAQVLTSLDELSLMGTPSDQTSIMCYQLPGSITRDGQPILGGPDINVTDYAFMGKIYPKCMPVMESEQSGEEGAQDGDLEQEQGQAPDDWDESEDVDVDVDALLADDYKGRRSS